MKTKSLYFVLLFLFGCSAIASPMAKITVRVTDGDGVPLEGAEVGIGLMLAKERGEGWGTRSSGIIGLTDSDGLFTGEGETQPHVTFGASKDGYYSSGGEFNNFTDTTGILGFRKYEPWNPTVELVLKKIINPIPMYAVRMSSGGEGEYPEVPVTESFVGFDLEANDWVVPHGLGTHRDFLFKVDVIRAASTRDYNVTLTLKFPNLGDGLVRYKPDTSKGESVLRFPQHAPASGYFDELVQHYESKPGEIEIGTSGNPEYETNYFFRVRTELDKDGNVIGGLYGKIHGPIELGNFAWLHAQKPYLSFNYYLNPNNNDTNIEYDPERNLFKDIPDRKKVSEP